VFIPIDEWQFAAHLRPNWNVHKTRHNLDGGLSLLGGI
jgi:hypothetical protein